MARTKQTPLIATRLTAADSIKFDHICRVEGKTRTDIARRAILEFLDRQEKGVKEEPDEMTLALESLEARHRRDTERLAKMIARVMMDVGIVNQVLYKRADPEIREQLWAAAKTGAADRLRKKRKDNDPEATEIVGDALGRKA